MPYPPSISGDADALALAPIAGVCRLRQGAFHLRMFSALGVLACCSVGLWAQIAREYDLKAVFLFNFASFVTWPDSAFSAQDAPFVIGILGGDPFGETLDQIVGGESAGTHPFLVQRFRTLSELTDCHVLYINQSENRRLSRILRRLEGRPTLTVGDFEGFAEAGGMIELAVLDSRVVLSVNAAAVQAGQLSVSSKLLEVANLVTLESGNQ